MNGRPQTAAVNGPTCVNMSVDQTIMLILLQKIASVLGPGKIQKKPSEDAFLTKDLSV